MLDCVIASAKIVAVKRFSFSHPTTLHPSTIQAPLKNKKLAKQCFLPLPHRFSTQSSQLSHFAVETGYLVSLYIRNFIFYVIYNFRISFNFHSNFNIFLRNIWGYLGRPWSLRWCFLWRTLILVAQSSILDFVVVLAASLDINCLYMYCMIGANSLFIEFVNMT